VGVKVVFAQWHSTYQEKQDSLEKYYNPSNKLPFEINSYLPDDDNVLSEYFKTYITHFNYYPVISFNESYKELKNAGYLMQLYFPSVEEILKQENLPAELAFLPYAASLYNPLFVNKDNRVGLWGFQYIIAKKYNLYIDEFIDERKDVQKATRAAANYLKDIYKKQQSWELTVLEFLSSAAIVEKAKMIAKSDKIDDFFKYLPLYLQHEYRQFFEAVYYYGNIPFSSYPVYQNTDTVEVKKKLSFSLISKHLFVTDKFLITHNPVFWQRVIPADSTKLYALVLPENKVNLYNKKINDLYRLQRIADSIKVRKIKNTGVEIPVNGQPVTYIVEPGDNLGYIAQKYGVKVTEIQAWNNIKGHIIDVGQELIIYTDSISESPVNNINKEKKSVEKSKFTTSPPVELPNDKGKATKTEYIVKPGDSLWLIAKKFNVTVEEIKKWNNKTTNRLDIGDKLIIYK
jgi:membrane-bound lytic murein transglycosylase D